MKGDRKWSFRLGVCGAVGLVVSLALFEVTSLDLVLQDRFFDFESGSWLVDRDAPIPRAVFYRGLKHAIIAVGVGSVALLVGPEAWRNRMGVARRGLFVAVLSLACGPGLVAFGKATTNVFCPWDLIRYGGDVPYVKTMEKFPDETKPTRRGKGFPAGHASGGFALVGLLWLRTSRRWRWSCLAGSISVGWVMGVYQMFKGAHFLSHTFVTMFVVWLIAALWAWVLLRNTGISQSDIPA